MVHVSLLAAAAAAGDAAATSELLERVWPDAFRVAWSILGERGAAEDVAQEACARLLTSIERLRNPERFSAWFYRIVVNESKRRRCRTARDAPLDERLGSDDLVSHEDRLDLRRALQALDPALRVAVVLHYYLGLNSVEIAKVVGASSMAVRWRLFVARRRLRPLLGAEVAPPSTSRNETGAYTDEPQAVR
jgi:RNA polymerase sigma factor (sigma-70 family)